MRYLIIAVFAIFLSACAPSATKPDRDVSEAIETVDTLLVPDQNYVLEQWIAGVTVDSATVAEYGIDRCFVSEAISDSVFGVIYGCSYHPESPVKRDGLRYLKVLHYDAGGEIRLGELVCNCRIANDLLDIFRSLYDARYPIEKIRLVDNYGGDDEASMADNNTSCYNCRRMEGANRMSLHAQGIAVDINPLYNPYVKTAGGKIANIAPKAGAPYVDRASNVSYMIKPGDACCRAFASRGFSWGGNWRRTVKDYQHFQKR